MIKELIKRYEEGATLDQLAAEFGISRSGARHKLIRAKRYKKCEVMRIDGKTLAQWAGGLTLHYNRYCGRWPQCTRPPAPEHYEPEEDFYRRAAENNGRTMI